MFLISRGDLLVPSVVLKVSRVETAYGMAEYLQTLAKRVKKLRPGSWPTADAEIYNTKHFEVVESYNHMYKYKVQIAECQGQTAKVIQYIFAVQMMRIIVNPHDVNEWLCFYMIPHLLLGKIPDKEKPAKCKLDYKELEERLRLLATQGWKPVIARRRQQHRLVKPKGGGKTKLRTSGPRTASFLMGLLAKGKISRTVKELGRAAADVMPETALGQLRQVHPPAKDVDLPDPCPLEGDAFDEDTFKRAIRSANATSSPGPDGMTMQMLKEITLAAPDLMWKVATEFAGGQLPEVVYDLYSTSTLCAIPKSNQAVRPIAISPVFVRGVGRALLKYNQDIVTEYCGRTQFGTGMPAAAEMMVHGMATVLKENPDLVVVQVDVANAFNTMSRQQVLKVATQLDETSSFSERSGTISPLAHALYKRAGKLLYYDNGIDTGELYSECGVRQGDPTSGALYCSALADGVMLKLMQDFQDEVRNNNLFIFGYADDGWLIGEPGVVIEALHKFTQYAGDVDQQLCVDKSLVYSPNNPDAVAQVQQVFPMRNSISVGGVEYHNVAVAVGVPLCVEINGDVPSKDFAIAYLKDKFMKQDAIMKRARELKLGPQAIMSLLVHSVQSTSMHVQRCVPYKLIEEALMVIDNTIKENIRAVLQCGDDEIIPEQVWEQLQLPRTYGGIGLRLSTASRQAAYAGGVGAAFINLKEAYHEAQYEALWESLLPSRATSTDQGPHMQCIREIVSTFCTECPETATSRRRRSQRGRLPDETDDPPPQSLLQWVQTVESKEAQADDDTSATDYKNKPKIQSMLQQARDRQSLTALMDSASDVEKARLMGCRGVGNTMFWTLVKLDPGRRMSPDEYATYGRFFLGMVIPQIAAAEKYCAGCSSCKDSNTQLRSVMDVLGIHATTMCKRGGRRIYLHDSVKWCLQRIVRDMLGKGAVWVEPRNKSLGNPHDKRRVDLIVHGANDQKPLSTDITVKSPCGYTYVTASGDNSSEVVGYAAAQGAVDKIDKHQEAANENVVEFIPFSCEMYGHLHADCLKWLGRVAEMGIKLEKLTVESQDRWMQGALQRIHVTIARSVAKLLIHLAGDNTDAHGKLEADDASKYVRDWRTGREDAVKRNPNLLQDARDGPRHWQHEDSDSFIISTGSMPVAPVDGVEESGERIENEVDLSSRVRWTYAELATMSKGCSEVYVRLNAEERRKLGSTRGVRLVRARLDEANALVPLCRQGRVTDAQINARLSTLWTHTKFDEGLHRWLTAAGAPVDRRFVIAH